MFRPAKILVPTDFSEHSDKALRQALDMAQEYGARVYLLHVAPGEFRVIKDDYTDISITEDALRLYEERIISSAGKRIEKQAGRVIGEKTVDVAKEVVIGRPEEGIVRFQHEKAVDLVVIASLGKSGLSRYIIGSVALGVLRDATCPVLLVK